MGRLGIMKKLLASSAIVAVVASALPLATAAALDGSPDHRGGSPGSSAQLGRLP